MPQQIKPMRDDLMVQQQIGKNRWRHMVAVMCLNLTYRKQVKRVLPLLFNRYPDPRSFIRGKAAKQKQILKDLGMVNVRTARMRRMSKEYLNWDKINASDLHGIGKYGSDSYEIFFKNNIPKGVKDKQLRKYIRRLKCAQQT